ncbi:hypothetical protein BDZ97DRAFT_1856384 [Flammula alnicola]|nr:hypothetical protein BDZ97DRAFT_1856384 [Flammula alnicola]
MGQSSKGPNHFPMTDCTISSPRFNGDLESRHKLHCAKQDSSRLLDFRSLPLSAHPAVSPLVFEKELSQEINAMRGINRLPVELLGQIFEMTVQRCYFGTVRDVLQQYIMLKWWPNTAPFNLLQVCRYWRAVAQSTSSLWTSLNAKQYRRSCPTPPAVKYWLRQSGSAPLNLYLMPRDDHPRFERLHANTMLQLFATECHRWRSLSIEFNAALLDDFIAILQDQDAASKYPLLEQLEIALCSKQIPEQTVDNLISLIAVFKSLRRLYWNLPTTIHPPTCLPWNQLHVVYIDTPLSLEEMVSYMSQCSSASSITMFNLLDFQLEELKLNLPVTSLSNLTSLTLRGGNNPISVLDYFILPNLEALEIDIDHPRPRNYVTLERFLERSQCPFRRIHIDNLSELSAEDILGYLKIRRLRPIQTDEQARSLFPRILAWDTWLDDTYVGWKDIGEDEELKYSWEDGELALF